LPPASRPGDWGNAHPNIVPYQTFKTSDGDIILACGNDNLFRKFCEVAGCQALADDPRFVTNGKRVENRVEITRCFPTSSASARRATGSRRWKRRACRTADQQSEAGVRGAAGRRARLRIEMDHPLAGKVSLVRSPMRFSERRSSTRRPRRRWGSIRTRCCAELWE
jgi:crotonobetainyl-CoA:carnitine CoA-transferase CaiB-like acyl-CoA transferase